VQQRRTAPPARAKTLRWQGLVNQMIRGLLRTPLLCRLVGKRLLTVYVVGRKSGRRYALPVAYTARDGKLLVGTAFGWVRNLRSGDTAQVRLLGSRRTVGVEVLTDEAAVVEHFGAICRANHAFAKFNGIGVDAQGVPDDDDLHRAWAAGARGVVLTPQLT
jgi:hypothetical protein